MLLLPILAMERHDMFVQPENVEDAKVSPIEEMPQNDAKSQMVTIEDFDLIRVIGRGNYAKVLMVELKKTRRIYAMKVIKKELVTDDEASTNYN